MFASAGEPPVELARAESERLPAHFGIDRAATGEEIEGLRRRRHATCPCGSACGGWPPVDEGGTMAGEVVVITGASAGVGRATALRFARDGARLGLLARGRERLDAAAREVEENGGRALALAADVADPDQVEAAAMRTEEAFGPIDTWINNAMTSVFSPVRATTAEEYRRVMDVNFLGFVNGTLSALRRMVPRDRGTIVQVGSALAYRAIPLQSAYCASKHAIQGFTESLWTELIHDGSRVHVALVHLPAINTPQFEWVKSRLPRRAQPVPPIYQPEIAAEAIRWAARGDRREIYVGASTVKVVAGHRLFPRALDHYAARTGYDGQQTDEPEDPDRPHNLWAPVPGDFGAHGRFDGAARSRSPQLWANRNRGWLAAAAGTAAALVFAGVRLARR